MERLTFAGFLRRLAAAIALVALTYNPSGHSYLHWVATALPSIRPLQVITGLVLLGGWAFFVRATWDSLGTFGVLLASALFAAVIWLFVSWGWLDLAHTGAIAWAAIALLSLLLGIGVSWSYVRRAVTGQTDVDEIDHR